MKIEIEADRGNFAAARGWVAKTRRPWQGRCDAPERRGLVRALHAARWSRPTSPKPFAPPKCKRTRRTSCTRWPASTPKRETPRTRAKCCCAPWTTGISTSRTTRSGTCSAASRSNTASAISPSPTIASWRSRKSCFQLPTSTWRLAQIRLKAMGADETVIDDNGSVRLATASPYCCCCCICCMSMKGTAGSGGCCARSTSTLQSSGMGSLRSSGGGSSLASTCTAT